MERLRAFYQQQLVPFFGEELVLDYSEAEIDIPALEPLLLGKADLPKLESLRLVAADSRVDDLVESSPYASRISVDADPA